MDLGLSHLSPQVHKNQVINSEFQWNKRPFYSYYPGREKDSERRANRVQSNLQRLKGTHRQRTNSTSYKPSDCFANPTGQFNFIRSLQSGLPYSHYFMLLIWMLWMYEVLWVNLIPFWCMCLTRGLGLLPLVAFCELFVNFNGMIHVVTFWFGGNSWLPYLVSLTCLLSFVLWGLIWLLQRWLAWCSTLFVGYHLEVYSDYLYWLTFFDGV